VLHWGGVASKPFGDSPPQRSSPTRRATGKFFGNGFFLFFCPAQPLRLLGYTRRLAKAWEGGGGSHLKGGAVGMPISSRISQ
jgi:hypothetical protein